MLESIEPYCIAYDDDYIAISKAKNMNPNSIIWLDNSLYLEIRHSQLIRDRLQSIMLGIIAKNECRINIEDSEDSNNFLDVIEKFQSIMTSIYDHSLGAKFDIPSAPGYQEYNPDYATATTLEFAVEIINELLEIGLIYQAFDDESEDYNYEDLNNSFLYLTDSFFYLIKEMSFHQFEVASNLTV